MCDFYIYFSENAPAIILEAAATPLDNAYGNKTAPSKPDSHMGGPKTEHKPTIPNPSSNETELPSTDDVNFVFSNAKSPFTIEEGADYCENMQKEESGRVERDKVPDSSRRVRPIEESLAEEHSGDGNMHRLDSTQVTDTGILTQITNSSIESDGNGGGKSERDDSRLTVPTMDESGISHQSPESHAYPSCADDEAEYYWGQTGWATGEWAMQTPRTRKISMRTPKSGSQEEEDKRTSLAAVSKERVGEKECRIRARRYRGNTKYRRLAR